MNSALRSLFYSFVVSPIAKSRRVRGMEQTVAAGKIIQKLVDEIGIFP